MSAPTDEMLIPDPIADCLYDYYGSPILYPANHRRLRLELLRLYRIEAAAEAHRDAVREFKRLHPLGEPTSNTDDSAAGNRAEARAHETEVALFDTLRARAGRLSRKGLDHVLDRRRRRTLRGVE